MNDYTLHQIALDKQRDALREVQNDRLAHQARAECQTTEKTTRQSLQEFLARYLPKKTVAKSADSILVCE